MTLAPASGGTRAQGRWRADVLGGLWVAVGSVLLGAPAGLLWSQVAPRFPLRFDAAGSPQLDRVESTGAFIGADATYFLVVLGAGLVCGALGWVLARRWGPGTVLGLALGGALAAYVAARVGLLPGRDDAVMALKAARPGTQVDLFLGREEGTALRAPWAALAWPAGAMLSWLVASARRPEDLD